MKNGVRVRHGWIPAFWLALLVLSALPLLIPAIPPLVDLPGHMGAYQLALHPADRPSLAHFYDHHWYLIGNLGVDLLMVPAGSVFGVEAGTKLVVTLIPVMTVLGFLLVARVAHGRLPPTTLIALPFAYNYPFHYGFVNYCLGMALMGLAFALWMRLADRERFLLRGMVFALIAPTIWIAHAVAWALLCVVCGSEELWRQRQARQNWPIAIGRAIVRCLPLCGPVLLMPFSPHEGPSAIGGFLQPVGILKWIVALNRDRWMTFDIGATIFVAVILVLAAFGRFGLRFTPRLGWPAAALLLLYVLAPQTINGSDFVSARIIPFAVAFALLAIRAEPIDAPHRRWIMLVAVAFFLARTAGTTLSLWLYDRSYREALIALDRMPDGSRIAAFSPQGCAPSFRYWANPRLQHLASIAILRQGAFTNDQWTIKGLQLVRTRFAQASPLLGDPSEVVTLEPCTRPGVRYLPDALAAVPRGAFDYVWLLGVPPESRPPADWLRPVYTSGETALYKIDRAEAR